MPSLAELIEGIDARILGDPGVRVLDVTYDSRAVGEGSLFVALRGTRTDGHRFLSSAVEAGACALLVEESPSPAPAGVAVAIVADTRIALASTSAALFGHPGRAMRLVGVTGTNGKTSTSFLIESMLLKAGRRCGLIGTVEIRYGDARLRAINTTPWKSPARR